MINRRFPLAAIATLLAFSSACTLLGGAGGGEPDSCKIVENGIQTMCQDYLGYSSATVKVSLQSSCTNVLKGAFSHGTCDRTGSLGGCHREDQFNAGASQTYWYFPGSVADGKTLNTPADVMANACPEGLSYEAP